MATRNRSKIAWSETYSRSQVARVLRCCREADVLLGESLGLQDILVEAGSEAAAAAAHLAELEAQLAQSQARVEEVRLCCGLLLQKFQSRKSLGS